MSLFAGSQDLMNGITSVLCAQYANVAPGMAKPISDSFSAVFLVEAMCDGDSARRE